MLSFFLRKLLLEQAMGKYRQQWGVSDGFWEKVEPLIPPPPRKSASEYRRKPGGGRKPLPVRQVFVAIVFVLRTGIQWRALPKELFGSPSSIHRYFQQWHQAGFFLRLWQAGLAEYDDMQDIVWEWQSIDGAMCKTTGALREICCFLRGYIVTGGSIGLLATENCYLRINSKCSETVAVRRTGRVRL
jgi:transposase